MENDINDPKPHILTKLEAKNTLTNDSLLDSAPKIEKFTIKDSSSPKWARKDISIKQQEKTEYENTLAPIDVDLASHKPFSRFANPKQI